MDFYYNIGYLDGRNHALSRWELMTLTQYSSLYIASMIV